MSIRPHQAKDIPDLVRIHIAAFASDASEVYRYPYKDQYPEDYTKALRTRYEESLTWGHAIFMVYELEPESADAETTNESPESNNPNATIAGYAVWLLPDHPFSSTSTSTPTIGPGPPPLQGRHVHIPRDTAFRTALAANRQAFFSSPSGGVCGIPPAEQLYLTMLAVDPSYQRRGIGEALLRYGMDRTRRDGFRACTVMASVVGLRLYRRLGFTEVGRFVARVEGEGEGEGEGMKEGDRVEVPGLVWLAT